MRQDVQAEVAAQWDLVDGSNLHEFCDVKGFEEEFLQLNGFAIPGVDYDAEVSVDVLEHGAVP
jgi:enoyl-[acyl-carrier protein] reductase/trans-2-enoyl-CoA reductase (NAD+)